MHREENMDKDIIKINQNPKGRIIAISDVHGGYEILLKLIDRLKIHRDDYLIIIGDFLQRGGPCQKTLSYIRKLGRREKTIVLKGNHEKFILSLLMEKNKETFERYLKGVRHSCILKEWINDLQIDTEKSNISDIQDEIKRNYYDELDYLKKLPVALELDDFVFVHAGVENIESWKDSSIENLLRTEEFLNKKHCLQKYVVVGHWPTQNYRERSLSGNPIVDKNKRIISIDGGYGVKKIGQINALIIEKYRNEWTFKSVQEDTFKEKVITKEMDSVISKVVKLDWLDDKFELVEKRDEFSVCKKLSTDELFLLKNQFIGYDNREAYLKEAYISKFLNVIKGDKVKIIEQYGEYLFVKHNGEVGWIKKECV